MYACLNVIIYIFKKGNVKNVALQFREALSSLIHFTEPILAKCSRN